MAVVSRDFRGLKCPIPTLRIGNCLMNREAQPGDILEVTADCPTFEHDVKALCTKLKKVLVKFQVEGDIKKASIQV